MVDTNLDGVEDEETFVDSPPELPDEVATPTGRRKIDTSGFIHSDKFTIGPRPTAEPEVVDEPVTEPAPAVEEPPLPKPPQKSAFLKAHAFNVLNNSDTYEEGINELQNRYDSAAWDDPKVAQETLSDYGRRMRQKFQIQPSPAKETYEIAPVQPRDVTSEEEDPINNRLDRVTKWREKNLEVLNSTADPKLLSQKDHLTRSINSAALEAEQEIRNGYRDEHWYRFGYLKDKAARFATAAIDPFYKAATGGEEFDALKGYIEPDRNQEISSKVIGAFGSVAVPVVGGIGVGIATGGVGVLPYVASLGLGAAQAAGEVEGTYNFIKEETGNPEKAAEAAGIEAFSQIFQVLPTTKLIGKAGKTLGALRGEIQEEVAQKVIGSSILKKAGEGFLLEGSTESIGQVISNQAIATGLSKNNANLFEGVKDSFIYGGLVGGVLGGIGGINRNDPEDTALAAVQAEQEGAKKDTVRIVTGQTVEQGPPPTEQDLKNAYPDPHEILYNAESSSAPQGVIFGKDAEGNTTRTYEGDSTQIPEEFLQGTYGAPDPIGVEDNEQFDGLELSKDEFFNSQKETLQQKNSPNPEDSPNFKKFFVSENLDKSRRDLNLGASPIRMINMLLVNKISEEKGFINFLKNHIGVGGYFSPKKGSIYVPRNSFASPLEAEQTLAHELGHFIDFMADYVNKLPSDAATNLSQNKTLVQKLARAKNQIPALVSAEKVGQVENQARALSQWWRSGWNGETQTPYGKYRNEPAEIYADVFSAMMIRPDVMKDHYKHLWRVLDKGFSGDSDLKDTWNYLKQAWNNPMIVDNLAIEQNFQNRKKTFAINQEAINAEAATRPGFIKNVKNEINTLYHVIVNRTAQAMRIAYAQTDPAIREASFEQIENITAPSRFNTELNNKMGKPIQQAMAVASNLASKVEIREPDGTTRMGMQRSQWINDQAEYENAMKIIGERTPAMARVEADPLKYSSFIESFFLNEGPKRAGYKGQYSIAEYLPESYKGLLREAVASRNPVQLMDLLARFQNQIRGVRPPLPQKTQELLAKAYKRAKSPGQLERVREREAKLQEKYNRSFDNKETTPIVEEVEERLKKAARLSPTSFSEIVQDLLNPIAFNARRYLANQMGDNTLDANSKLQTLKNKYGDNFSLLENFSKTFHNAVNSFTDVIERSGIFTPEQIQRIKLNKDVYTTNLVLAYYEGNDSIDSSMKGSVGSLQATGDEISATILKLERIAERATMQDATNSLMKMAAIGNFEVEVVKVADPRRIWSERDRLNAESKTDSYHVVTADGKASLLRVKDGYDFRFALQRPADIPFFTQVGTMLENFNQALKIRELKTVYNPTFVFFSKFYDNVNLGLQRMVQTGDLNPFTTAKEVYTLRKQARADIKKAFKEGKFDSPDIKTFFTRAIAPNPFLAYTGADERGIPLAEQVAAWYDSPYDKPADLGDKIERMYDKAGIYIEKTMGLRQLKMGADWFRNTAEIDELTAKLSGFRMMMKLGMGQNEAAHMARSNFGVPDPTGGGIQAPLINKFFLFGRAHINGLRTLGRMVQKNPKALGLAYLTYVALPKLFVGEAAATMVGGMFGDEAEKSYKKWLDKVPSFEKIGKTIIPIGFLDNNGSLKFFGEQTSDQIGDTWKAYYLRIPQERVLTDITRVTWPLIEELLKGNVGAAVTKPIGGATDVVGANLNPGIQYMANLGDLIMGNNPKDYFRDKPIVPSDIYKSGNPIQIMEEYGKYMSGQLLPQVTPYNPYASQDAKTLYDQIQRIPLAGPLTRAFVGASNYGQYEAQKEEVAENEADRASIRINLDDDSKSLYSEYRSVAANIRAYGKDWRKKYNAEELPKARSLYRWQKRFSEYSQNIRMAEDRGDYDQADYWRRGLEDFSKKTKQFLEPEESTSETQK